MIFLFAQFCLQCVLFTLELIHLLLIRFLLVSCLDLIFLFDQLLSLFETLLHPFFKSLLFRLKLLHDHLVHLFLFAVQFGLILLFELLLFLLNDLLLIEIEILLVLEELLLILLRESSHLFFNSIMICFVELLQFHLEFLFGLRSHIIGLLLQLRIQFSLQFLFFKLQFFLFLLAELFGNLLMKVFRNFIREFVLNLSLDGCLELLLDLSPELSFLMTDLILALNLDQTLFLFHILIQFLLDFHFLSPDLLVFLKFVLFLIFRS